MRIYLFASRTYPNVKAFMSDKVGENLPDEYAPWYAASSGPAILVVGDIDPIAKFARRDGYFLVTGKARTDSKRTVH
jgi:hypothetical protein